MKYQHLIRQFATQAPSIPRMMRGLPEKRPIEGVQHVIAVASGKGGVGKSTVAVNLAMALSTLGIRTGILDADIYGPSIPRMLNLSGRPNVIEEKKMLRPMSNYGVRAMSMGFLIDEGQAVVWRGLMIMKALEQMLRQVDWSGNDVLVIDMPPGTGDTQLTISQQVPLSGAVIVSTPQDIALIDAKKGVDMFQKVNVPILGMVQNMSFFCCPNCNHRTNIFGEGGVERVGKELGIDLLGDIPLDPDIVKMSDAGTPVVISKPDTVYSKAYLDIAQSIVIKLGIQS